MKDFCSLVTTQVSRFAVQLKVSEIDKKTLLNLEENSMDWRVIVVLLPIAVAGGWALFNIGAAALAQVQKLLNSES